MSKRPVVVVFLLLLVVTAFSFDTLKAEKAFKVYVEDYERESSKLPIILKLKEDLKDLALYRLYKLQIAGSIEKKESTTTIPDLLTAHMKSLDESFFSSEEEKIAYSAFLAWVVSIVSGKNFQIGTINEMPAYSLTFNSYSSRIRSSAPRVYESWVAYALGLLKERPEGFPDGRLPTPKTFSDFDLDIVSDIEEQQEIASITDAEILRQLSEAIEMISAKEYNVSVLFNDKVEERVNFITSKLPSELTGLEESTRNLLKLWIFRSLSLIPDAPYFPESLPIETLEISGFINTIPLEDPNYEKISEIIKANNLMMMQLNFALKMIARNDYSPVGLIEADINSEAKKMVAPLLSTLGQIRNELSAVFVSSVSKKISLGWLRILFYILIVALAFTYLQFLKKYLVYIIVGFETFYLLFISNPNQSTLDLSLYAIVIIPLFVFAILITLGRVLSKKRKVIDIAALILIVFASILPFVKLYKNVPELSMEKFPEFYESIYYDTLKEDLFVSPNSLFNIEVRKLTSLISAELNELKRSYRVVIPNMLNDLAKNTETKFSVSGTRLRVTMPAFDEYLSIEKEPTYISNFEDLQKAFKSFVRNSKSNFSQYNKVLNNVENMAEEIVLYAGEPLRADFEEYLEKTLGAKPEYAVAIDNIEEAIIDELNAQPIAATIAPYKVPGFAVLLLGIFILVATTVIFKNFYLSLLEGMLIVAAFIGNISNKNLEIFVQAGTPYLKLSVNTGISVWFFTLFTVIIVLAEIFAFTSYKKGRESA
ncbi:hypothetical protein [Kosmotoga pacifica]|uniref:Uncharacterized protein n=1 Tax=Kosmotoga pacifica TaxID=1330330 RepID=A0A0G2Z602_9BACT|nr:hypothetical protein [Kosmotoga pacifica]AKI96967.1 hypothetical protein IX53_03045 [Kosmotoga pacifica]